MSFFILAVIFTSIAFLDSNGAGATGSGEFPYPKGFQKGMKPIEVIWHHEGNRVLPALLMFDGEQLFITEEEAEKCDKYFKGKGASSSGYPKFSTDNKLGGRIPAEITWHYHGGNDKQPFARYLGGKEIPISLELAEEIEEYFRAVARYNQQ